MSVVVPTVELNSGYSLPLVGLGTWMSEPDKVGNAVEIAIRSGYRHIDCAFAYLNQEEIGEGIERCIKKGLVERKDLFITTKIWNTYHSAKKTRENFKKCMCDLRLDYLDLLLIHWPQGYQEGGEVFPKAGESDKMLYSDVDYLETWKTMEQFVKEKKVHSIGLSNFNHKQIERICAEGSIKPAVLQIEFHPYFQQRKLREFCDRLGIAVMAYSPLGNMKNPFRKKTDPCIMEDPVLIGIGKKYGKTSAQVVLRWIVQQKVLCIPKSISEERIKENINVFDFSLTDEEMTAIDNLDRNWRTIVLERDSDHMYYPFNEEY
ncbi:hypothetical protein AB6A40_004388 [Gnathostoma spinigerum]|uniref:NADP-dependent oxidoreductase domain-containing protein n=1 Tax=Gnathostoma spinigerum TaxID=75299 RepID=A0ABD6EHQ3_9BILA